MDMGLVFVLVLVGGMGWGWGFWEEISGEDGRDDGWSVRWGRWWRIVLGWGFCAVGGRFWCGYFGMWMIMVLDISFVRDTCAFMDFERVVGI